MRIAVVGLRKKFLERTLIEAGFKLIEKKPDIVISFGGDGTALLAERLYPGVPRLMIKHKRDCKDCKKHDFSKIIEALKKRRFKVVKEIKVEGIVNGDKRKRLIGLNEISIHHKIPTKTVTFRVKVNGKIIARSAKGDGLIVSTPYGSGAYFYSVCKRRFSKGLGIAFNNCKERLKKCRVVNENSIIEVEILKDKGLLVADNNPVMIPLREGDRIRIRKAREFARIIEINGRRRIKV